MVKKQSKRILSLLLAVVMLVGIMPMSAFAAPNSDIPSDMLDNLYLDALAYTGYNVQAQKNDGTIFVSYGSSVSSSIRSDIGYDTGPSGLETVADSSTVSGKAPNIAKYESAGLCCASYVSYVYYNYLPNIAGVDTSSAPCPSNPRSASAYNTQANSWVENGQARRISFTKDSDGDNFTPSEDIPIGSLIVFKHMETGNIAHVAIYAGYYNGHHFVTHVGNERGPEFSTIVGMSKGGYPESVVQVVVPEFVEDNGAIEVYKKDTKGNNLSGAVFVATHTETGKQYKIGPTNSKGYAITTEGLPYGSYKVKETVFPTNFQSSGKSEWTVTINSSTPNGTVTIHAVNEEIPGSCKIVKTSEDDKVDGISFRVQGNGVDTTVKTKNGGVIQVDDLKPGIYTVTEVMQDKYEPQETRRVTVVSNQVSTVTFSNVLKRGSLTVTKTAEDNLEEGAKFRLHGTSLSGLAVDEYATVGSDGKAYFEDVLIGTDYVLEEVDTEVRYVVPQKQTATIEWNKVTEKSFHNILKKWRVDVFKVDGELQYGESGGAGVPVALSLDSDEAVEELGYPYGETQGDASLAGAVYGVYQNGVLLDTYTTDANGYFLTDYYPCAVDGKQTDVYIQEITPSEGYLLDSTRYPVDCYAEDYSVELNTEVLDVYEQIIKGQIAIIKHTDNGETQIENPEVGAEFEVFLKVHGSYENAKDTERDYLVCDENGFACTKPLPYGIYTVKQTKGWEGKELMEAFDVFISNDGEVYRYLINNAPFESYIKVVKTDSTTGKTIPYAGAAFEIYNPDGSKVEMTYTYPEVTTIDTFYTTADGTLVTPQELPYGTGYTLVEVSAPYGYVLDKTPVYFDVTEEASAEESAITIVKVEKQNKPQMGTITVTKTGEIFSTVVQTENVYQPVYETAGLEGAVYEVTAAEDIVTLDGTLRYSKGDVVDTITTEKEGMATTKPLYLGKFEVREITSPYGMVLSKDVHLVELTYAGQEVEITETATAFYNERQKASLGLIKVMATDEKFQIGVSGEILSVQFGLFAAEPLTASDGTVIPADALMELAACDENGSIVFNTDIPVGAKLYVKEVSVDNHYILSDTKYPIEFVYAGQDIASVEIKVNDGEAIKNEIIYGKIQGLKIDRETEDTIAGAVFGLFRADAESFTEETALLIAESDENGVFSFENVPYGKWFIKELQPAADYLANEEVYAVEVTEHGQVVEITVVNDRIPEIGTKAEVDGEKEICATEIFVLTDTVEYKHLIPGKEYVLKGVLMDKSTGKPLLINDQEITAETVFIPDSPTGAVTVSFTFDARCLKTETDIVVFETLYRDGKELTAHADIEDEGQTVKVKIPEIGTQATIGGKKEITTDSEVTITDTVAYKNLTVGKEYTLKGVLMNKATGQEFTVDGAVITSEVTFTPETTDGEIKVEFTFNAKGITAATEIVVFEKLYREDVEIAVHTDIEDEGQTVKITPPTPPAPQTGDESNIGFWIGLGGIALGGIIAAAIIYLKQKKEDDGE